MESRQIGGKMNRLEKKNDVEIRETTYCFGTNIGKVLDFANLLTEILSSH